MTLVENLKSKKEKLAVVGLGYVGMPLAVAFAKKFSVIGFDINSEKVKLYQNGIDPTNEVGSKAVLNSGVDFTSDEKRLNEAKFIVVAVPTPINADKTPDLLPVTSACEIVGRNLCKGSAVVFESTVYPGVTEDICIPILERESGLECGKDFIVGYSPERINPGDKVHRLENIVKVVSGINDAACDEIALVYGEIIEAGIHKASSIKVAEAAKVVENSQRDINIAFMNELSMVFNIMGIDTREVIDAMNTKWNALKFYPGLVGGHCIGVDPYYFIYEAEKLGYHSQIILSGRKINDGMAKFVAENIIKQLILADKPVRKAKVAVLGLTFKEDCPDTRNSKVEDIINHLRTYEMEPVIFDPVASKAEIEKIYGCPPVEFDEIRDMDCVVFAVAHKEFKDLSLEDVDRMFAHGEDCKRVLIDVKGIFDKNLMISKGYRYWRL